MKKLVVLLACLGLVFQLTSCTSNNSQSDSEVASDMESGDLEKLEGDEALEVASDDSLASDQLPEDALGETTPSSDIAEMTTETTTETMTETTTTESTMGDSQATTDQTEVATSSETLPADPFAEQVADVPAPPVDGSTTVVDSASTDSTSMVESSTSTTYVEEAPKKPVVSLQKVATTPWKSGKTLYNAVYFARPGDSLESISQMIYGADRVKELKKGNAAFASRDVRPGDKVYYNSPNRPDDSSRIANYYEESGQPAETYIAKEGDNIRTVSKEILGYDNAWKEIWSSNSVDSKGNIAAGTELRYWKGGAGTPPPPQISQEIAGTPPPPAMPSPEEMMAAQQASGEIPPPPMPEAPPMDMPPPPPPPQEFAQEMAPPPPPPMEAINPPAPVAQVEEAPTGMDNDTTMALAVVGLAAAGLAALIVARKKRKQKELEQQGIDHTHVGT
ncbi:MAG: LysM peptidoglycan-binding domain-containing protein [Bdellovibrio sp.]|nr:LysM peptidoglycan-binding domain-containing protein [Bdellovibrio sp.]